jgi:phytanoyl-CoA hydroxylase
MQSTGTRVNASCEPHLTQEQIEFFNENGYLLIDNVVPHDTCDKLRKEIQNVIDSDFDPAKHTTIFRTDKDVCLKLILTYKIRNNLRKSIDQFALHNKCSYFYDSADKISFFLEADAIDKETGSLIREKNIINKIGHALHEKNETFKDFSFQDRFYNYAQDLCPGICEPIIVQSMYIFKQVC